MDKISEMLPEAHNPKQITLIPSFYLLLSHSITLCLLLLCDSLLIPPLHLPTLLAIKLDEKGVLPERNFTG